MTIPPPTKGWSTKQPISEMDAAYSPELENWFPNGASVDLRRGYRKFSAFGNGTIPGRVGALFEYVDTSGTALMIAIGNDGVPYKIDTSGTATDISAGLYYPGPDTRVYFTNFRGRVFVKGDSTTDVYVSTGGNLSLAAFTGPSGDDKALSKIAVYRSRLYFMGLDASMWYGGSDAVTGALTQFDFQSQFQRGGRLLHIGGFSPGSANKQEQYFVAISSRGEVLLYSGSWPEDSNWQLAGKYTISPPIYERCFFNYGNDLLIITSEGLVSLTDVIGGAAKSDYVYLTDEIQSAYRDALAVVSSASPGFSAYGGGALMGIHYPVGNYLLINIPVTADAYGATTSTPVQFVMNTITGAWTKFTNQTSSDWCVFDGKLFFSGQYGKVFHADYNTSDTSTFDEDPSQDGVALSRTTVLRHSFNPIVPHVYEMNNPRMNKQFTSAKPIVMASNGLSIAAGVDVDFEDNTATGTYVDTADTTYKLYRPTIGLTGLGEAASFRIDQTGTRSGRMSLQATRIYWNDGDLA